MSYLSRLEYTTYDPDLDYVEGVDMSVQRIIQEAQFHAERLGIELDIPAVFDQEALEDVTWTFGLYGEDEYAEEFENRYIHAERLEAVA